MTVDIFQYDHTYEFLRDSWKVKQSDEPNFSLSKFAESLGFGSSAPLSLMLKGRRPVPKKYLPTITTIFDLQPAEVAYLDTLMDKDRAKTIDSQSAFVKIRGKQSYQRLYDFGGRIKH